MPPILAGRSDTSKASIVRMPDWPARSFDQVGSTPLASGVTMPSPVTTTRLIPTGLSLIDTAPTTAQD